mmetsp:Transcript_24483/g.67640  ORF Transcript_24483/g.67640 Transcript_24483/m.67640 type:complete len:167 (+) Transcript_24483:358-858(+)
MDSTQSDRDGAPGNDYIKTMTHNYVSRKAIIEGAKRVEIKGRSILHEGVKVRGDLQIVKIGRYCEIGALTSLEPAENQFQKERRIPMIIGSHTHIGKECDIRGAAIGSSKSEHGRPVQLWRSDFIRLMHSCLTLGFFAIRDNVFNFSFRHDDLRCPMSDVQYPRHH